MTDALDPAAAPAPGTTTATFAFAQVYQTLVRIDCTGALVPGLATAWSTTNGRDWSFRLATNATFADGVAVTAAAVAQAWSTSRVGPVVAITAVGTHELEVTLDTAADAHVFASPALAIARRDAAAPSGAGSWPAGTGPFTADTGRAVILLARNADPFVPDTIVLRTYRDPRAAIDAGIDVIVTNDPAALAYARERSDYRVVPLPWNRMYSLWTRTVADGAATPPTDAMAALARDAVHVDARPAETPAWWPECAAAAAVNTDVAVARGARDIVYPRDDRAAREIAERITALAWPRERAPAWLGERLPTDHPAPRTVAAGADAMTRALDAPTTLAAVIALPRVSYGSCPTRPGAGWTAVPLVDTRDHLVYRPGIGRIDVDAAGTIRFAPRRAIGPGTP